MFIRPRLFIFAGVFFVTAGMIISCGSRKNDTQPEETAATIIVSTATPESLITHTPESQLISAPVSFGPDKNKFPPGYNPLTGLPVVDKSTLELPAMLLSISNFPAEARPQAGLSFADFVYEFTITAGENRFLGVYYGDFPFAEVPPMGDCEVRTGAFTRTETILGNRVWFDANKNGAQDVGEHGLAGVCVNLYDGSGSLAGQTTTDTNGYYGFNVRPGTYSIEFVKPQEWQFTESNVGYENQDSDVNQADGRIEAVAVSSDSLIWDAGLVPLSQAVLTPQASVKPPKSEIGPIRSGRIFYSYFANMYQDSCLVYASADEFVLERIPHCAMVAHEFAGGGEMMSLERFIAIAKDNGRGDNFNYASNLYSDVTPKGGSPANQVNIFWANLNQAAWLYDPLYAAYWRFTDKSDKNEPGVMYPAVDRLNGRQLAFENFIVLFADHNAISPTIINIDLDIGASGDALLFRDGNVYDIEWSTMSSTYEKQSGKRRPIQFLNVDGSPAALKPGHTWVMIVTPFSLAEEKSAGVWRVKYYRTNGEATGQ